MGYLSVSNVSPEISVADRLNLNTLLSKQVYMVIQTPIYQEPKSAPLLSHCNLSYKWSENEKLVYELDSSPTMGIQARH